MGIIQGRWKGKTKQIYKAYQNDEESWTGSYKVMNRAIDMVTMKS